VNYITKQETRARRCDEQMSTENAYSRAMDEALAADPPVIEWVKGPGGVRRAVKIHDPHTRVAAPEPIYVIAAEPVFPTRETPLLAAAKAEI
jgi:hypothetical protein